MKWLLMVLKGTFNASFVARTSSEEGGINDASGSDMPHKPTTSEVKADRAPKEETDVLEALLLLKEQPAYPGEATFSDDESGTGNLDDEPAANNPDQVLMTCSDKGSSSMECYGGDERRVSVRSIEGMEEDDLNRNVDDSDVIQKQKRKPDLSIANLRNLVEMQRQNMKADINIPKHRDSSVMQMQNEKLGLNLLPHNNSDHEVPTPSVSYMDDLNALVPTNTNSCKETKTVNVGVDINIPEHKDSSVMQMQNKKLGFNLLPHNDSLDPEVLTPNVSSMDDLNTRVPTDTNSDKETKTVNGDVDINIPEHRDSSMMQMQNKKLGLNLLPHNENSDHEVPTLSGSSMDDDLNALQAPIDTNSNKKTETVNGGQM
ncbi:hypothetical protein E2562_002382 [Oryza meyeriana var. granulata]|uniref:Uncharacterized protein n=1 Tax=Oryza meyeriana var. granulata TaxID=110450 RepID=A0A6G1BI03_9ORYZ|nr:hypothetical protein E2562_002382 [Oryza meyeriana var. granulata]